MNRLLWRESYSRNNLPRWPCPQCGASALIEVPKSAFAEESRESAELRHSEDWDPERLEERCCFALRCSACNDVVVCIGHMSPEISQKDGEYENEFYPIAMYPHPPMAIVPEECADAIRKEIRSAEALIWVSPSSACSRLRVAVERMLDELHIPKFANSKGRRHRLNLHYRILKLPYKHQGIRDHLLAVKWLGNEGAHEQELRLYDVIDGLEVLEHALDRLL